MQLKLKQSKGKVNLLLYFYLHADIVSTLIKSHLRIHNTLLISVVDVVFYDSYLHLFRMRGMQSAWDVLMITMILQGLLKYLRHKAINT